jgi:hypothetical protein
MSRIIRVIPRELLKHLEWTPGQEVPTPPPTIAGSPAPQHNLFSLDDLIRRGQAFENTETDGNGKWIGLPKSLQETTTYVGTDGVIASMPYLIGGKAQADTNNYLWKNWYSVISEENVAIDKKGLFVPRGKPVLLAVHGGGLLTADRIFQAYTDGLTPQNAAKYSDPEFDNLLEGRLPNGETITIYTLDDVKNKRIPDPFGRYAVALDFALAQATASGYHDKGPFLANPVVLIRAGTPEHLEPYFDKAKKNHTEKKVGNWHRFGEIDPSVPQGRVLFVNNDYYGLSGDNSLYNYGRFVGVAPEARGAR